MKRILFVALSLIILSACSSKSDTSKEDTPIDTVEINNSKGLKAWNNIFLLHPDSLSA